MLNSDTKKKKRLLMILYITVLYLMFKILYSYIKTMKILFISKRSNNCWRSGKNLLIFKIF